MKRKKIIGAKVRTLCDIKNRWGYVIPKNSIVTIVYSHLGYTIEDEKGAWISRVAHEDVEFIEETK